MLRAEKTSWRVISPLVSLMNFPIYSLLALFYAMSSSKTLLSNCTPRSTEK